MSKEVFRSFYRQLKREDSVVTGKEALKLYQSFFPALEREMSEPHVFDQVRGNEVLITKVKLEIQKAIRIVISNIPFLKNNEVAPIIRYNIEKHIEATSKNIHLLTQPYYDPLTWALTRSFLREWRQLGKKEYTVIVVDLDNFKTLNDTFGHQAWDKHLQKAAEHFSSVMRYGQDYLIRTGGDEFFLLIDTLEREVIHRITSTLRETSPRDLHFSYGVAFSDEDVAWNKVHKHNTLEQSIAIADKNMYENKAELKDSSISKKGSQIENESEEQAA